MKHYSLKSDSFNVAIIPSPAVIKRAIPLSRKLKREGGLFVLNKSIYATHITLYMTEFPVKNLPAIKAVLKHVASKTKPFRAESLAYLQTDDGYVAVSFKRSQKLSSLQRKVITALNPLREGLLRKKDIARLKNLPKAPARNIKKYGFRNTLSAFHPHLTLTKLGNPQRRAMGALPHRDFSFVVKELGMFYLGEYGSCKKVVTRLKLGK